MQQAFRRRIALPMFTALLTLCAAHGSSVAASNYPAVPVEIIVPFSAGGDADQSARNLAASAQASFSKPLVVMNRGGANGVIGSQFVKNAKPDGHTLLLARVGPQILLPALQPSTTPYRWDDFTFIGMLESNPIVCVVHPESDYKEFNDLVQALRSRPGSLAYSHPGVATIPNLTPQLLFGLLGLGPDAAINVAYKGGGEAAMAVLSREVDFSCGNLSSLMGNINAGRLRPILVTTQKRLDRFPSAVTAREAGYPDLESMQGWSALYGPPGMEPAVVQQWAEVLQTLAKNPKWLAGNENFGGMPNVLSPGETREFVQHSAQVMQDIIKTSQLKTE